MADHTQVTRVSRPLAEQARIRCENCVKHGAVYNKQVYAAAGKGRVSDPDAQVKRMRACDSSPTHARANKGCTLTRTRCLTTILPDLTLAEAIETTRIHPVAGDTGERTALVTTRPCRRPHHPLPWDQRGSTLVSEPISFDLSTALMASIPLTGGHRLPRLLSRSNLKGGYGFVDLPIP